MKPGPGRAGTGRGGGAPRRARSGGSRARPSLPRPAPANDEAGTVALRRWPPCSAPAAPPTPAPSAALPASRLLRRHVCEEALAAERRRGRELLAPGLHLANLLHVGLLLVHEPYGALDGLHDDAHGDGEHGDAEDDVEDTEPGAGVREVDVRPLPGEEDAAPVHRGGDRGHAIGFAAEPLVLVEVLEPHEEARCPDPDDERQVRRLRQLVGRRR
mmetsp:Transcript_7900/g.22210  ORF Transcript_7900/g.22210 Transcript_7900/m.22210 type:complete len:215 (+) Transcript_7900:157-801(+)